MTAVINTVILVLVGVSTIAALYFIVRALRARTQSSREAYGVGQVEARQAMQIDIARGIAFIFVGLILLGVYGLSSRPAEAVPLPATQQVTPTIIVTETAVPDTAVPTEPAATATSPPPSPPPTTAPTDTPKQPTATASPPLPTDTPAPRTATVSSGVGVYLRAAPSTDGEELEWVLQGTVLTLLPGQQQGGEFEWQQVRTPDGNEGWVATEFIVYNE